MSDLDSPHSPDHPMQDAFSDHEPDHEDHDHHGVAMVIEPATQIPSTQPPPHHVPTEEDLDAKYPNRPKNTNPTLPFHTLYTELFEPLLSNKRKLGVGGRGFKNLKPHEIRQGIIERFIDLWRGKVGLDIYPAFRLSGSSSFVLPRCFEWRAILGVLRGKWPMQSPSCCNSSGCIKKLY